MIGFCYSRGTRQRHSNGATPWFIKKAQQAQVNSRLKDQTPALTIKGHFDFRFPVFRFPLVAVIAAVASLQGHMVSPTIAHVREAYVALHRARCNKVQDGLYSRSLSWLIRIQGIRGASQAGSN